MHKAAQFGKLIGLLDARRQSSNTGQNQAAIGSYVTIEPSGRSSISSTSEDDADSTAVNLDDEDHHDMLAAMYEPQDQNWLDNCPSPEMNYVPDLFAPELDYAQGVMMNGHDVGMNKIMDGYGYLV
ncbi:hypothetical protein FRC12_021842 [Ceratobasidium sp. 428]|nr:hypothetical protein FRC12_021842 [Ceratobasidium sp. 428]